MTNKEDFIKHLIKMIGSLSDKHKQRMFIDDFLEALREVVITLELGDIKIVRELEIREESKDEDDEKDLEIHVHKLTGEKLEAFMEMLKEDGIDMEKVKESFKGRSNSDDTEKKVGDSVVVVSKHVSNYMHDYDTKTQLSKNFERPLKTFIDTPAIVIETDIKFKFNCGHCDLTHHSDCVIYFPSLDKKYHISSRFVRLI